MTHPAQRHLPKLDWPRCPRAEMCARQLESIQVNAASQREGNMPLPVNDVAYAIVPKCGAYFSVSLGNGDTGVVLAPRFGPYPWSVAPGARAARLTSVAAELGGCRYHVPSAGGLRTVFRWLKYLGSSLSKISTPSSMYAPANSSFAIWMSPSS